MYSTLTGRFLSADPLVPDAQDPQAWNSYGYVRDSPVVVTDSTGARWDFEVEEAQGRAAMRGFASAGLTSPELVSAAGAAENNFEAAFESVSPSRTCLSCGQLRALADSGFSSWTWLVAAASGNATAWLQTWHPPETFDAIWELDRAKYPDAAGHVSRAIAQGHPRVLTIGDPATAAARGREALRGMPMRPGYDRDEFPPKKFEERPKSREYMNIHDNRGSGASMGNQLRGRPPGTRVIVIIKDSSRGITAPLAAPRPISAAAGGVLSVLFIIDVIANAIAPRPATSCPPLC
jgi:hypothetical protein